MGCLLSRWEAFVHHISAVIKKHYKKIICESDTELNTHFDDTIRTSTRVCIWLTTHPLVQAPIAGFQMWEENSIQMQHSSLGGIRTGSIEVAEGETTKWNFLNTWLCLMKDEALTIKFHAKGHKCQDRDSNPHSADQKHQSLSPVRLTSWPQHPTLWLS